MTPESKPAAPNAATAGGGSQETGGPNERTPPASSASVAAQLLPCPDCKGKGTCFAHVNAGPDSSRHWWGDVKCLRCKGSGQIQAAMVEWMRVGKILRDRRVARDESLFEAAKRLGMKSSELSAIEHGRVPVKENCR